MSGSGEGQGMGDPSSGGLDDIFGQLCSWLQGSGDGQNQMVVFLPQKTSKSAARRLHKSRTKHSKAVRKDRSEVGNDPNSGSGIGSGQSPDVSGGSGIGNGQSPDGISDSGSGSGSGGDGNSGSPGPDSGSDGGSSDSEPTLGGNDPLDALCGKSMEIEYRGKTVKAKYGGVCKECKDIGLSTKVVQRLGRSAKSTLQNVHWFFT